MDPSSFLNYPEYDVLYRLSLEHYPELVADRPLAARTIRGIVYYFLRQDKYPHKNDLINAILQGIQNSDYLRLNYAAISCQEHQTRITRIVDAYIQQMRNYNHNLIL